MDKLEKNMKSCFLDEAHSLEDELEDETLKPADGIKEKILRKIAHNIELRD